MLHKLKCSLNKKYKREAERGTLLQFVSVKRESTYAEVIERKVRIVELFREACGEFYSVELPRKTFFRRCLNLFFFYQVKDPYEALLRNDYGYFQF